MRYIIIKPQYVQLQLDITSTLYLSIATSRILNFRSSKGMRIIDRYQDKYSDKDDVKTECKRINTRSCFWATPTQQHFLYPRSSMHNMSNSHRGLALSKPWKRREGLVGEYKCMNGISCTSSSAPLRTRYQQRNHGMQKFMRRLHHSLETTFLLLMKRERAISFSAVLQWGRSLWG